MRKWLFIRWCVFKHRREMKKHMRRMGKAIADKVDEMVLEAILGE